jgi:hypothetical protein
LARSFFIMKKVTGQFRNTTWDPLLIISQIIALQCVMYVGLGLWMIFMDLLVGSSRSLDHLFKYQVTVLLNIICFHRYNYTLVNLQAN